MQPLTDHEYYSLNYPDIKWVSLSKGTRKEGEIENLAASYFETENIIKINRDYEGFWDIYYHYLPPSSYNYPPFDIFDDILVPCVDETLTLKIQSEMWSKPQRSSRTQYYIHPNLCKVLKKRKLPSPPNDDELTGIIMKNLKEWVGATIESRSRIDGPYKNPI